MPTKSLSHVGVLEVRRQIVIVGVGALFRIKPNNRTKVHGSEGGVLCVYEPRDAQPAAPLTRVPAAGRCNRERIIGSCRARERIF